MEADVTVRTWLRHGPGGAVAMYCQSQLLEGKKYVCLNSSRPPGHGRAETAWRVTSKPCPEAGNSTRLQTSSWCLRICRYYAKLFCVTWYVPEYLGTSPWQSQHQMGILAQVQSQHSLTSASCSSTRLFCASLRASRHHLYQHAQEKETETCSSTVVEELFNPSLIFAC